MTKDQEVTEVVELGTASIETKGGSGAVPEDISSTRQPLGIDAE